MGRKHISRADLPTAPGSHVPFWAIALAGGAVLCGVLFLYGPALYGHFVFDDLSLPFTQVYRDSPLAKWLIGLRPVLMFSYWVNYHLWGDSPFSYHLVNVLIHFANVVLVYLVLRRLLGMAGWSDRQRLLAASVGALLFAIHPLQTESVSYIAGRSESLVSFFMLLAYFIFLYARDEGITWRDSILVLLLFGMALKTKENAVSLAGILVLTDLFWPIPFSLRGLKRNWRLYALMVPGVLAAIVAVFRLLSTAQTAGFSATTFKWYQYGFTEARAIFTYIRLAIFPIGQSIDQDYPASHTILEHGTLICLLVLAGLIVLAILWRRRYPLFSFGLLMFLTWLAPTSSIVPIDDALVERRMYLALLGLILIACEFIPRLQLSKTVGVSLLIFITLVYGKLCYDRNRLWGKPDKLLEMAAANAVYNPRPMLNFTEVLIRHNRCDLAASYLTRAEHILPNNYYVNAAWGRTEACLGHFDRAIARLQTAARLQPCSQVYEWMGLAYTTMGHLPEAGQALQEAVRLGPNSESAHGSLALWYENVADFAAAEREYQVAVHLDRTDEWAWTGLNRMRAKLSGAAGTPDPSSTMP